MSRALREALEEAESRLPEVKRALEAPPDPAFAAARAALEAELPPLRARQAEAARRRDDLRAQTEEAERELQALELARSARFSREKVGSTLLVIPAMALGCYLAGKAVFALSELATPGVLGAGALVGLAFGAYARRWLLPGDQEPRV